MSKKKRTESSYDDGSYVVKKSRKINIVAFILCLLIAFVIWLYASNTEKYEQNTDSQASASQTAASSANLPMSFVM